MDTLNGRLKREHDTLRQMTEIYCSHHHVPHDGKLCEPCNYLLRYAEKRLEKCPYGSAKPACSKCPIHCYKPLQRQQVQTVMRFAGPRMPLYHPLRSLTHFLDKFRRVEHPMELRRRVKKRKPM
jgi:hypothetical protein